jgi:penicillin-insensitive murein endopeptidase
VGVSGWLAALLLTGRLAAAPDAGVAAATATVPGAPGTPTGLPLTALVVPGEPTYCDDLTRPGAPASLGRAAWGKLQGGARFEDGLAARVLPLRHVRRCLNWGTPRLVQALHHAGAVVQAVFPGTPPLGVGDLSRAGGGPIDYSFSHQSGRDADLAFYMDDASGRVVPSDDLWHVGADLLSTDAPTPLRFDVARNWALVRALLEDTSLQIEWLFIAKGLRKTLLDQAKQEGASAALRERAAALLHQPEGAPPHNDHLHLRVLCAPNERKLGCKD